MKKFWFIRAIKHGEMTNSKGIYPDLSSCRNDLIQSNPIDMCIITKIDDHSDFIKKNTSVNLDRLASQANCMHELAEGVYESYPVLIYYKSNFYTECEKDIYDKYTDDDRIEFKNQFYIKNKTKELIG